MKQTQLGESYPLAEAILETIPASLLLTTNRGLEFMVIAELKERCQKAGLPVPHIEHHPFAYDGHVLVQTEGSFSQYRDVIFSMRSVEHVIQKLATFQLPAKDALNFIALQLSEMEIPGMEKAGRFRITSRRVGDHDFGSMDVQRVAGEAVVNRFGTGVNLNHPDLELRSDVYDETLMIGIQATLRSLTNRHNRVFIPRISLKPHVAYTLVRMVDFYSKETPQKLLDPFCGSGSILLEAAHCYPNLDLQGSELYEDVAEGARRNIREAGLAKRIKVTQSDVYNLEQVFPSQSFDAIVTNPPFGIKLSPDKFFPNFYAKVLEQASKVLKPGGILVMLSLKWTMLKRRVEAQKAFEIKAIRKIETGGMNPRIVVLKKLGD